MTILQGKGREMQIEDIISLGQDIIVPCAMAGPIATTTASGGTTTPTTTGLSTSQHPTLATLTTTTATMMTTCPLTGLLRGPTRHTITHQSPLVTPSTSLDIPTTSEDKEDTGNGETYISK